MEKCYYSVQQYKVLTSGEYSKSIKTFLITRIWNKTNPVSWESVSSTLISIYLMNCWSGYRKLFDMYRRNDFIFIRMNTFTERILVILIDPICICIFYISNRSTSLHARFDRKSELPYVALLFETDNVVTKYWCSFGMVLTRVAVLVVASNLHNYRAVTSFMYR